MQHSLRTCLGLIGAFGLLIVLAACDSGGANDPGTVMGLWEGSVETDSVTYELAFDLEEAENTLPSESRVVGEGELMGEDTLAFQIPDGSFTEPTLSLTLNLRFDESPHPILLQGTVGEDYESISAELSGGPPRFDETPITLTRP